MSTTKPVMLAPKFDAIPAELTARHQWVNWILEYVPKRDEWTKPPYTVTGALASTTDPTTWAPFDDVMVAYEAGAFDGIGFALDPATLPLVGIDLDKVLDADGALHPEARRIVETVNTYTEVSPSGRGLRLFAQGPLPEGWRNTKKYTVIIEMYDSGRYLTVTGHHLAGTPLTIETRATEIAELHARVANVLATSNGHVPKSGAPMNDARAEDAALLTKLLAVPKFAALWAGDTSRYGGDESAADLALCALLAQWTDRDPIRIDAFFRRSGLMRDKWDARRGSQTYGERTIATALSGKATDPKAIAAVAEAPRRTAVIVHASDVTPETLTWLWPGRLAVGALTNVVGLPDQGKSLLYADLAARMSTGSPMPPDPLAPDAQAAQRVLILTAEDSWSTTVVPRLLKAHADVKQIDFVRMVRDPDGQLSLLTLADDLDTLEAELKRTPYGLLIVDGIAGYLGPDVKTHNDADVRRVLTPFVALLERSKLAGLSVMHPPKSVTSIAYYAGGSVAFSALPRVTLGVAKDPTDDSDTPRRLLLKIKGNLYGVVPTLAYHIQAEDPAGVPWLVWQPEAVTVDLADVLTPPKESPEERSIRRECERWLRDTLAAAPNGLRLRTEVEAEALAAGYKAKAFRLAREALTDSVKLTFTGPWMLKRR